MYSGEDYDLAGFAVGAVERSRIVDGRRIAAGHRILALASSGPHSNGYSLVRKVLERSGADPADALGGQSLGEALLAPTRIYVKPVLELLEQYRIDGVAHITGGGITENIIRVLPDELGIEVDTQSWDQPAVFGWLAEQGGIEAGEMLRTFNCGVGMVLLVSETIAPAVQQAASALGEPCSDIGAVVPVAPGAQRVVYR
jgi:phosphoribosylformylglycinamidine cyclo-ligase